MSYEVSKYVYKKLIELLEFIDSDVGELESKVEQNILEGVIRPILQAIVDLLIDLMSRKVDPINLNKNEELTKE